MILPRDDGGFWRERSDVPPIGPVVGHYRPVDVPARSRLGDAGFVCAVLGLFVLPIVLSTLGIIFGAVGKSKAAVIVGIIGVVWVIVQIAVSYA